MRKFIYVLIVVVVALALWIFFGPKQVSAPTSKGTPAGQTPSDQTAAPVGNDLGMPDTGTIEQ